jgi:hypothetical protein
MIILTSKSPRYFNFIFDTYHNSIQIKSYTNILIREKTVILGVREDNWNIIVQDEFIFVHDYIIRRKKWISENKRPIVTVTVDSRKRTIVFGSLSLDGKQLFKQYDKFNNNTLVDYLKQVQKRFVGKCIIFVDRAKDLTVPKITRKFLNKTRYSQTRITFSVDLWI